MQRLDHLWPSSLGATRMDQYMLGGSNPSLLVAPVSPFWLAARNANAPPFNRSRLVWVPPGEWTDSFSGKILVGPATVNRSEVCMCALSTSDGRRWSKLRDIHY